MSPLFPALAWACLPLCLSCAIATAAAQDAPAQAASPAASAARVNINEYLVRGNTVLDAREIERAVSDHLGPDRTLQDVEAARAALQAAYQGKGYQSVYVDLPEQQVSGGVVILQVTETRIGQVRVVGAQHNDPARLGARVPALQAGVVPDFERAQQQLTALNRGGKRQVVPLVKQGTAEGTMDVELKVEDKSPWRYSASLNNDHSADTEPLRSIATIGHDNLWQKEHTASLTFFAAPQDLDQANVWSAAYGLPLAGPDWMLDFSGYRSDSNVVSSGQTNVTGKGHALGVKLTHSLPMTGAWWHQLSIGVDFKDLDESVAMVGQASDFAPLKYAPLTLAYSGFRQGEQHQLSVALQAVFGARSLFGYGSSDDEFDWKRAYADPSFFTVKVDLSDTYTLSSGAQWFARLSAQITDQPLVSGEQFAAGGMYTTRGYRSAEGIGDYGALATLEWRTRPLGWWGLQDWRLYGFIDGAWLGLRRPLPEQADSARMSAIGLGSSLRIGEHYNLRLDYGHSLSDGPTTTKGANRLHLSVGASY
ncbi:ShlB/FhaC/HecB family hemolysin secretion/activation protein [Stenotrophomonas rhizophila]|uniref:ShlB/FhaC/HecB family hemolysin secretion/activation protein n=1 Tax=Stenotrophomonas rhizophila TaxID=216778 RepID=UPI001E5668EC|nr:ShlB/FhaC/HecB family hemolysin secretion/activation protein [Stenotrophomonas rhizophila]MCC7634412.1 ShlB/FhaC/HecB family hemolysin secretion/activation protein [Stenotrophomonas rhizophila]MCC7663810.1 ShlB/FhaC/HecB family hemolysin secretion/activation protein [Stenotrophomonas rhizophila]